MAKKKKLLPKNFKEMLVEGDIAKLRAVFDDCDLNARGGYAKQTALAFVECPDALARWLVEQGADLTAADSWGNTPLHTRSRSRQGRIDVLLELGADVGSASASLDTPLHTAAAAYRVENVRLLLQRGARVDALNREGLSPLELPCQSHWNHPRPTSARLLDNSTQRHRALPRQPPCLRHLGTERPQATLSPAGYSRAARKNFCRHAPSAGARSVRFRTRCSRCRLSPE